MKLRNKKTGMIGRLWFDHQVIDPATRTYAVVIQYKDKNGYECFAQYFTLAELNAEWEDYDEQSEKEAIAMLEQISEAIDKINANIARICGKGKK